MLKEKPPKMLGKLNWRYAIGEICIVIIGISIAFALNRWAQISTDQQNEKKYLTSLLADVESEKTHLEENIKAFEQKIQSVRAIMPYLYGKQEGIDTISPKVFALTQIVNFHPNDVTYKTLINSGDLGLFNDFDFRKNLENHYSDQELIIQDYGRQRHIHEKYFGDFMIHNMDYNALRQGDFSFLREPILQNIIQSLYGTYTIAIESSKAGIARCEEMIKALENLR